MDEKGMDIEQELSKTVEDFYKKHVPPAVRKYIEKTSPSSRLPGSKSSIAVPDEPLKSGPSESDLSMDFQKSGFTGFNEA